MELEKGAIGAVGAQSVELVSGKLVVKANAAYGAAGMELTMTVDGKVLLDALVAKLPAGAAQDIAKALEGAILGASAPSA